MGYLSNKIDRDQLKPGDHIYSWRHGYIYAHHGIYVGEGNVIHFTRGSGLEIGTGTVLDRIMFSSCISRVLDNPCPICGYQSKLDGVISSCIDCFLSGGNLYLFGYGVTPALFHAARGGTCTLALSDPPLDVIYRASYLLLNGFGVYNIFKNNCEDFAIYCKTSLLGRSGQVASYLAAATTATTATTAVLSSALGGFRTTGFSGPAAVGYGMYCFGRLVSDIAVRRDVKKVALERLVAHFGSSLDEPEAVTETHAKEE